MSNIIDFNKFLSHKKQLETNVVPPPPKLMLNKQTGKITSELPAKPKLQLVDKQREERIKKIQNALERINKTMAELKALADERRAVLNKPTIV